MIKGILFDFDGVIADSEPIHYISFNETLKPFGINIPEERWYNEFIGTGSPHIMKVLFKENGIKEDIEKWVEIRRENLTRYIEKNGVELKKGLNKFLEILNEKGIQRAVTSGSREETVKLALSKSGISDYFEVILGRKSVKKIKPDPEVFLLGAEKLGLNPEECLIIEDSRNGITAAKSAGIPYICMKGPGTEALKDCRTIIKDYTEFPLEILEEK